METEKQIKIKSRRAHLECLIRILVGALCYPILLFLLPPTSDERSEIITEFLMAFVPATTIVILIPVFIRGSPGEKIVAIVFLLPAAWFGFWGWYSVVYRFLDHYWGH